MALILNEGKACDAIMRYLEAREGAQRQNLRFPEDENHKSPVEMVCTIGGQLYAFEHTGIEPFTGFIQMNNQAGIHFEPIRTALAGILPLDVLELHIPAKAFQGLDKRAVQKIQEAIINWVKQTAPSLPVMRYGDYIGNVAPVALAGVPFDVLLYRFRSIPQAGQLNIVHRVQDSQGLERTDRMNIACEKKFPKLAAWKRDEGAKSILILEDNDIQLTNHASVAQAFVPLARARDDQPDETYLVVTCVNPWLVHPILINGLSYFDLEVAAGEQPGWEVNMDELIQLTKR